ncbi:uroporphyrinogen-III synthase [Rhodopila sp.]|uniref:uroporphyrinogen-III synthase n=1 Tax=Rhodopila sp. TaxID=2480087 RepID=UPI003D0AB09E
MPSTGFMVAFPLANSRWSSYCSYQNMCHIIDPKSFDKSGALAVVLITRPEPGASKTAARVAALGFTPVVAPVMSIQQVGKTAQVPHGIQATILTSRSALAAIPAACHDLLMFAVGDVTAALARGAGFKHVMTAGGDATALADLVSKTIATTKGSLFLPTGFRQGLDLATNLRNRGFRVVRHVVYRARGVSILPTEAEINLKLCHVRVIMFFSAETARHFVRLLRAASLDEAVHDVEAVTISRRSTVALGDLTWRRISVASKPNQDAMLALLK